MDDRIIVDSILKDGRKNLFSLIMKNYGSMVFSKVLGITKNTEMAKDVTQTTFIRAFTSLSTWKGKDLGPWLAAIAAHEALNKYFFPILSSRAALGFIRVLPNHYSEQVWLLLHPKFFFTSIFLLLDNI